MEEAGDTNLSRLIDRLANNAWPALETEPLDGWLLRASGGLTRRANSVLASGDYPAGDWLDHAAHFYRSRNLPLRFQVTGGSPPGLSERLDALGYVRDGESYVFTSRAEETARLVGAAPVTLRCESALSDGWLQDFLRIEGRSASDAEGYRAIMGRIAQPALFVSALLDGEVVGIGTGVYEQGWAGLLNIATAQQARNRGIATAVVGEIARWGTRQGATHLYLQVMQNNAAAISLYRRLGFGQQSSYYYATEDPQRVMSV